MDFFWNYIAKILHVALLTRFRETFLLRTYFLFPQALSDSVISQGVSGGGAEGALASQLKEKESLVIAWLQDREEHSATMCREVTKLTTALQDYQGIVQVSVNDDGSGCFHQSLSFISVKGKPCKTSKGLPLYTEMCCVFHCLLHNSGHLQWGT